MPFVPHILSPETAPWVSWTLLGLLLLGVLSELIQPGVLLGSFAMVFQKVERTYHDPHRNAMGQLCINLFRMGTFALAVYLFCYVGGMLQVGHWQVEFVSDQEFRFSKYLLVLLVVFGVDTLKYLLTLWVNYTFQISRRFALITMHYDSLWTVICSGFFVMLLLLIPVDNTAVVFWSTIVWCGVAILLILFKWVRVFYSGPASLLYILLYVLTLEVLPIVAIAVCAAIIV